MFKRNFGKHRPSQFPTKGEDVEEIRGNIRGGGHTYYAMDAVKDLDVCKGPTWSGLCH